MPRHTAAATLAVGALLVLMAACTRSGQGTPHSLRPAEHPLRLAANAQIAPGAPAPELVLNLVAAPTAMAISPDGTTLTVVDMGRHVQRWRVADGTLQSGFTLPLRVCAYAPGGECVACYDGETRQVAVIACATGREVSRCPVERGAAPPFLLSADGRLAIVARGREASRVVRMSDGETVVDLPISGTSAWPSAADFDGDRRVLLGYQDGSVRLVDLRSGATTVLRESPEHWIPPMASSMRPAPDPVVTDVELRAGLAVAAGPECGCSVWDATTGELLARPIDAAEPQFGDRPPTVAISPDGQSVALVTHGEIRVWDMRTATATLVADTLDPTWLADTEPRPPAPRMPLSRGKTWYDLSNRPVGGLATRYATDGDLIAAGTHGGVSWLWRQGEDARPIGLAPSPFLQEAIPLAARVVPDGRLVVWARGLTPPCPFGVWPEWRDSSVWLHLQDDGIRRVLRWETDAGHREETRLFELSPDPAQVRPEAGVVLTSTPGEEGGRRTRVWSASDGELLAEVEPSVWFLKRLAFGGAGSLLAVANHREVRLLSLPGGALVRTFADEYEDFEPVRTVALSADGSRQAIHRGKVLICDTATGEQVGRLPVDHGVVTSNTIALSPAGDRLAVASSGVEIYDAQTGERLGYGYSTPGAATVHFSPDGEVVAAGYVDGTVTLHDGRTAEVRATIRPHDGADAAFPADSEFPVLAFSEDGRLLTSVGSDGTVAVTDVARGEVLVRLMWVGGPGVPDGGWIAWTPDGRYDGTDEATAACVRFRVGDQLRPASEFPQLHSPGLIEAALASRGG